jgi:alkylhydroperoxidase family enzyme
VKFLVRAIQSGAERKLRVPAEYLGRLGDASLRGLIKLMLLVPASAHRKGLSPSAVHAARIVTAKHEDCGSCVQIAINAALDDGVPAAVVRAVVDGQLKALSPDVTLAVRFSEAVLANDGSEVELRREVESSLGEAGLCDLALAIGVGRSFPTVKRALGFGTSCSLMSYDIPGA